LSLESGPGQIEFRRTPGRYDRRRACVAAALGLSPAALRQRVAANTAGRQFGILGEPRVNVLKLNLALDQAAPLRK
jgi:potassium-transporting ATPase KdpC subunit